MRTLVKLSKPDKSVANALVSLRSNLRGKPEGFADFASFEDPGAPAVYADTVNSSQTSSIVCCEKWKSKDEVTPSRSFPMGGHSEFTNATSSQVMSGPKVSEPGGTATLRLSGGSCGCRQWFSLSKGLRQLCHVACRGCYWWLWQPPTLQASSTGGDVNFSSMKSLT